MAVHALRGAGLDPSYVVGGELRSTGANAGWGTGEWIVVEADESDRSLLKLDPEIAILTNAELDHHTTYSSRLDLEQTLREFMARAGDRRGRLGPARSCGPCVPPGAVPYDAPDRRARARPASRFTLARDRGPPAGPRRPQRGQRRRRADRLRAGRRRPGAGGGRAGRLPRRPAPARAARRDARRARPSTTTTPTTRPRWRRRSPPCGRSRPRRRGRRVPAAPVLAHARARAGVRRGAGGRRSGRRAADLPGPGAARPTSRASTAAWSPRPPPTPGRGRPVAWMPAFDEARALLARRLRDRRRLPGDGRRQRRLARPLAARP